MSNLQRFSRLARRLTALFFLIAPALVPVAAQILPPPAASASTKSSGAASTAVQPAATPAAADANLTPAPQSPQAASPPAPVTSKTAAESSAIELPKIVVTAATREEQTPESTATTTTVLTHDYLEQSHFVDVPSALQFVPGMSTVTGGMQGSQTSVFIHGLDSNETLVTVDGRRQAVGLSGADDNLANLTLDDVDQIEVVRTPISSVDGGSAMGGVINLVTLSGRGLAQPEGSVSFEAGSFDSFRENAQSRGAVGNFDYAISATRQDVVYPSLSPGFPDQADQYRNTSYRGNFGYQVTPDVYVDLHSAYNNAYTSVPGEFVFPDPTANLDIEDWNLSPEVVANVTDFYKTKLYYTHDQQRQAFEDPFALASSELFGISPAGDETRLQINTDSIDWQNDFQIARNWTVTAGIQGDNRHYYEYDDALGMRTFDSHDNNIGGYISSQWQPLAGLNVLSSGRYDSYSQFGGAFTYRQAVSYTFAPTQTNVHASVARAFSQPPLQDLLLSFPGSFGSPSFFANPNLQPETDLGWEAGVAQPLWDGRITPSATYFHNSVRNEIGDAVLPSGNFMEENIGKATTDGVETGIALKPIPTITANLNYTYLNAVDDTTQMRLVRRPRNSFQFSGTWNPIAPLTFTLGGNWVMNQQDFALTAPFAQGPIPDYFILRASASYQINDQVSLWVRGENLTDRNYQPVLGFFGPSIAGYGGIKISF
jgi:vitamin B12 transporter